MDSWALTASSMTDRSGATASTLTGGRILGVGGQTAGAAAAGTLELFDPEAGTLPPTTATTLVLNSVSPSS